jgi:exonuclease III
MDEGLVDVLNVKYPSEEALVAYIDKISETGKPNLSNSYRMDYILVSKRIADSVISADILAEKGKHGSWHLPIQCELCL